MKQTLGLSYCLVAYLFFTATTLYLAGFLTGSGVPKSIDDGRVASNPVSIAVNVALLTLFALQHSVMARSFFKKWLKARLPMELERSTYIIASCFVLWLLFWLWQPIPVLCWNVESTAGIGALYALAASGALLIVAANLMMGHFEFTGLTQGLAYFRNEPLAEPTFRTPGPYRWMRHPMMTGLLMALWAAPVVSYGRLLFNAGMSLYILIGVYWEEKDLAKNLGDSYGDYRRRTRALLPVPVRRRAD